MTLGRQERINPREEYTKTPVSTIADKRSNRDPIEFAVVGDALMDITFSTENIAPKGVVERRIGLSIGGVANVAIWSRRLGVESAFVGKVGNDIIGDFYLENLASESVIPLVERSDAPTGICICMLDQSGERTMVVQKGANDYLSKDDLRKHLKRLQESRYAYFSAFSFARKELAETMLYLMRELSSHGSNICLSGGAPNVLKRIRSRILRIAERYVDVFFLNWDEATVLSHEEDEKAIVGFLSKYSDEIVVTKGEFGSVVCQGREITHVPAKEVKAIDTTGAGDAFAAGYIVGKLRGHTIAECARDGNEVASRVVTAVGSTK